MKVSSAPRKKVRTLVSAFTSALLVASGLALAPAAAYAAPAEGTVAGATLDWGVKQSFRGYLFGPIAHGAYELLGNTTASAESLRPAAEHLSWSGGTGTASMDGSAADVSFGAGNGVHFTGHEMTVDGVSAPALDMQFTNPRVEVTSATEGTLYLDVKSRKFEGMTSISEEFFEESNVPFATLSLAKPAAEGRTFTWSAAPATLTAQGGAAFGGFYTAGAELDPVTFTLPVAEVVVAQDTTTSLDVSAAKITEGDELELTATVAPAEAVGTVQFKNDAENLGGAQAVANGVASLRTSDLQTGDHSLTAEFVPADPAVFNASTSDAVTVTVEEAEEPVVWEPELEVFLEDGTTPVGNTEVTEGDKLVVTGTGYDPEANVGGRGVPIPSTLPQGVYVVFGEFAQNWRPSDDASSSARAIGAQGWVLTEKTVDQIPSQYQGMVRGQWVELNADGSFEWEATIEDHDGTKQIKDGQYGVYTYAAGGMKNASQEQSVPVNFGEQVAGPVETTTTVAATASEITEGDEVTLSATVAPAAAAGTVQFTNGEADLGEPVTVTNGAAELKVTDLPVGAHRIAAEFAPEDAEAFAPSASTNEVTVTVSERVVADPKITVTPSEDLDPAVENTLTVEGTGFVGAGAANGAYVLFGEQSVWSGEGALPSAGWITQGWVRPNQITDGSFTTTLQVPADTLNPAKEYHVATSAAHGLSVTDRSLDAFAEVTVAQPAPEPEPAVETSTTLSASADVVDEGDDVTLSASVAPADAEGSVQFSNGETQVGGPVALEDGTAELAVSDLPIGEHRFTAAFTPADEAAFTASNSEAVTVTVEEAVAPEPEKPSIEINGVGADAQVSQGEKVTFTAGPFDEGQKFQVEVRSETVELGEQTARDGVVTVDWTVPVNFEVGEHAIVFIDEAGDELSATFEVLAAEAPGEGDDNGGTEGNQGGSNGGQVGADAQQNGAQGAGQGGVAAGKGGLANTGSDGPGLSLLFAGGAMLLGAAGLMLARRRTAAHSE